MERNRWMQKAIFLAYCNKGKTSPNPTVGAVLLDKNNQYLGCSVTDKAGGFHAERRLLQEFSTEQTEGGTLFVTLEPCCFYGKTAACTDIIIEKKITRVIIAIQDPNPKVSGQGISLLEQAGVSIEVGLFQKEAMLINRDFFYAIEHQKPFVFGKFALSLDGCLATYSHHSQWISNPRLRRMSHILRYRADAILVGSQTVLEDNPKLNIRLFKADKTSLYRIILDRRARIPLDKTVFSDELPTLWIVSRKYKDSEQVKELLQRPNKEVFFLDDDSSFENLLYFLYQNKNIISVMVEGGAKILSEFIRQRIFNSVFIAYGNMFLGNGLKPFQENIETVNQAPILNNIKIKRYDEQYMVLGDLVI